MLLFSTSLWSRRTQNPEERFYQPVVNVPGHMASETLLIFVLMLSSVRVGKSAEANYSSPIITSESKHIESAGAADLYCRASGGYPAGTIHWFDQRNTNWTLNSTLQITQGHDGLFTLSSKLSIRSIDTTRGPFRCVVLNYRYEEEGERTTALERKPLFKMKCQSAVGVIGKTTNICCNIESQTDPADIVTGILNFKEKRIYMYITLRSTEINGTGDSRFQVKSLPSLQLHNTSISDVGEYKYFIQSIRGTDEVEFKITANYSPPILTSEPAEIESGGSADLYCRASGGYPAGTIHWFDQRNTNWTQNSTLQITQGHNGLFTLSSKLSFRSIDSTWTPFRCVVLNYRYEEEGERTTALWRKALFKMKCQSAVGVIGKTTNICCNIESQTDPADIVTGILNFKEKRIYMYITLRSTEINGTGDSRFQVESLPSLQLHNTSISDVGEYKYFIQSTRGTDEVEFKITAKYSSPIITSEPKEIEDGGSADLYCRASGGYPAGTIHWFDQRNTNWTQNSTLQITQGHDGLFTLSSKLSFRSIDTTWTPFRCVVLNYRYEEEEEQRTTALGRKGGPEIVPGGHSTVKIIMATVILIGSLIVCLMIVVLVKLRVTQKLKKALSMDYPILSAIEPVDVDED